MFPVAPPPNHAERGVLRYPLRTAHLQLDGGGRGVWLLSFLFVLGTTDVRRAQVTDACSYPCPLTVGEPICPGLTRLSGRTTDMRIRWHETWL